MKAKTVIAILRHNTKLPGDARLAQREFDALIGQPGRIIESRSDLIAAMGGAPAASVMELASGTPFVALGWDDVATDRVAKLVRCAAFAQEVFLLDTSDDIFERLRKDVGPVAVELLDFSTSRSVVVIAWNYLIESEGVLDSSRQAGRVGLTANLLLEPYSVAGASKASLKLRKAKKTTLSLSHDLHIYKAKFFPRMVRAILNVFGPFDGAVLDPFCGSGTALLEAALIGLDSAGSDIDPICCMISKTKVAPFLDKQNLLADLERFDVALSTNVNECEPFELPEELQAKLVRRDRIDGTAYLSEIRNDARVLAHAVHTAGAGSPSMELLSVLASDAVTKKIRYRFVGVGNGRYTIEIVKQSILSRVREKIERCRQLAWVFEELQTEFGMKIGQITVAAGDARDGDTWPTGGNAVGAILTSPPYLPASSGREHYGASRALAFAVLGFGHGKFGYHNMSAGDSETSGSLTQYPEAKRLMEYLASDSKHADPQRDAMRFLRKATPTREYLADIGAFLTSADAAVVPNGLVMMVVASQHIFYSHRRQEIEHVVSGASLYGEIAEAEGMSLSEEISMELLKSAASRAKPRATDEYRESILVLAPSRAKRRHAQARA